MYLSAGELGIQGSSYYEVSCSVSRETCNRILIESSITKESCIIQTCMASFSRQHGKHGMSSHFLEDQIKFSCVFLHLQVSLDYAAEQETSYFS